MKMRLYSVIGSLLVLGGVFAIAWYLVMVPAGDKIVETTATAAASQDESIRLPEAETAPAGLADYDPSTAGDEVGGIATGVPVLTTEETRATNIQTVESQPVPTESRAARSEATEPQASEVEQGASALRPGARSTVEAQYTEIQPPEPQSTPTPVTSTQEYGFQPVDGSPTVTTESEGAPVVIRQGQFKDGDEVHKGSGTAAISQKPDGSYLIDF